MNLRDIFKFNLIGLIFLFLRDLNSYWLVVILRIYFLISFWSVVILCGKLSVELCVLKVSGVGDRRNKSWAVLDRGYFIFFWRWVVRI